MQNIKHKMDIISDYSGLLSINESQASRSEYINIKCRGGTIRLVTEITKDNIGYCRELMNIVDELRHLEGIKGTIGVSENEYVSATVLGGSQPKVQLIYSNASEVIEQGQYIFDMLWNTAIPYVQKLRQIAHDDKVKYETTPLHNINGTIVLDNTEETLVFAVSQDEAMMLREKEFYNFLVFLQ